MQNAIMTGNGMEFAYDIQKAGSFFLPIVDNLSGFYLS